jgi:hypothetical protein
MPPIQLQGRTWKVNEVFSAGFWTKTKHAPHRNGFCMKVFQKIAALEMGTIDNRIGKYIAMRYRCVPLCRSIVQGQSEILFHGLGSYGGTQVYVTRSPGSIENWTNPRRTTYRFLTYTCRAWSDSRLGIILSSKMALFPVSCYIPTLISSFPLSTHDISSHLGWYLSHQEQRLQHAIPWLRRQRLCYHETV